MLELFIHEDEESDRIVRSFLGKNGLSF